MLAFYPHTAKLNIIQLEMLTLIELFCLLLFNKELLFFLSHKKVEDV